MIEELSGDRERAQVRAPQVLALTDLDREQMDRIVRTVPGGASNLQDVYPLSPLQEGMLFHHVMNQINDTYVLSILFELQTPAVAESLTTALQAVIDRHDVLRSVVLWENLPHPVQVVYRRASLHVSQSVLARQVDMESQLELMMQPTGRLFDLRHAPLVRLQIAASPDHERCYAVLFVHHIVCDHQSLRQIAAETVAHVGGTAHELPPPAAFKDHVLACLARAQHQQDEAFFRRKLSDVEEPTAPFGCADVRGEGTQVARARCVIEPPATQRIRVQARRCGVSVARLLHAAWSLVVAKTSGRTDVVFGTVVATNPQRRAHAARPLGLLVNTLPLRIRLHGVSALDLVRQTHAELTELLDHEQASLVLAQRCSGVPRTGPLFTALLNFRRSRAHGELMRAGGVQVLGRGEAWTNYPITVTVDDFGSTLEVSTYTESRLDPTRIAAYLHAACESLIDALDRAPQTPALSLSILPAAERQLVLRGFNATRVESVGPRLIHELFERQVLRTPSAMAVVHADAQWSYGAINARANQLARVLRDYDVGPDQLVGICLERSIDMVVALLATLKARAAYLPLDPGYPAERLAYMLQDASPRVVLTSIRLAAKLPVSDVRVIALDAQRDVLAACSEENLASDRLDLTADNLVYVIYTSGSTGRPKGIAMTHGAVANLLQWQGSVLPVQQGTRVLQFAALSFDVAFQEVFSTLCSGGTLVVLDEQIRRDPRALLELLAAQRIHRLFLPPLMLQGVAEHFREADTLALELQDVITAGEQLRVSPQIRSLFERLPGCRLHNHYGPTETHVVTALTLDGDPHNWPVVPSIGRPIANTRIHVLDELGAPVPVGVPGEIHIGGASLARGYLNRPGLTGTRFLPDSFSEDARALLYRTGDLGRWCADGAIEYLGRNDDQVKIRGFRVELGEVEAHLASHPATKEAAVTVHDDASGAKKLVAYVTVRPPHEPSVSELRAHMKAVVPDYMVPSAFVLLERMPLTPSGKLDRRGLPVPRAIDMPEREAQPPATTTEQMLADIWAQLLDVENIGRDDNFFDLGGHSLLAMQLLARIQSVESVDVPMRSLFEHPTLRALGQHIDGARRVQLLEAIAGGGEEIEALLERVAVMPENRVRELLAGMTTGNRP